MQKLSMLVVAVALAAGCGKKDADKAEPAKTTETKPADTTKPAEPAPTEAPKPTAAEAKTIESLKPLPEGLPQVCKDAEAAVKKLIACEKADMAARADISKSWNVAVDRSYVHYKGMSDSDKKTIDGTCQSMTETVSMLTKDCP